MPQPIHDVFGIREQARRRLPRLIFDFIDGSTGTETAENLNRDVLQNVKLQSRIFVPVEHLNLETTFLGNTYNRPFGIAPMGMCNLINPNADDLLCSAAKTRQIPHCVSTAASSTLEHTFQMSAGSSWFQLYATTQEFTSELLDRAEEAGYTHLIFTADTPRLSRRVRDLDNGFAVPLHIGPKQFLDFATHPAWSLSMLQSGAPKPMNFETSKIQKKFDRVQSRGGADWAFLDRLRKRWPGKIIVKGVMSVEDAGRVRDSGCDAIYVSNHGGRQLDSTTPAISALPKIRNTVGPEFPIIFDSGVRSADDIVRALALGANFVMIGRPVLYALGANGAVGLNNFFDMLEDDLKSVMAQIGATSIEQLNSDVLASSDTK